MLKWFAHIINLLKPKKIGASIYDAKFQEINRKLKKIHIVDTPQYASSDWFKLQPNTSNNSRKNIVVFVKYRFRWIPSLSFLKEERIQKEKDRIAKAIQSINIKLSEIDKYVGCENLEQSMQLLSEIDAIIGTIPSNVEVCNNISKRRENVLQLCKILKKKEEEKKIAQSIQDIDDKLSKIVICIRNKEFDNAKRLLSEIDTIVRTIPFSIDRNIRDSVSEQRIRIQKLSTELKKREEDAKVEKVIRDIDTKLSEIDKCVDKENLDRAKYLLSEVDAILRTIPLNRKNEVDRRISRQRDSVQQLSDKLTERRKKKEIFEQNGIRYFYHFTAKENLESIKKYGGLYSWDYCDRYNIRIPVAGGDEMSRNLDKRVYLEDYVRLSFCSELPMAYRVWQRTGKDLVLLRIKIDVAYLPETKFSDINAADGDSKIGENAEFIEKHVSFRAIRTPYLRKEDPDFKRHQAEVLVKTFVPIDYIVNIDSPEIMYFR